MVKRISKSFIVAGFVLLSISSTWALSAFTFEAACVARSALRLAASQAVRRPFGTYAVPTYDDALEAHKKTSSYVEAHVKDDGVRQAYDILARHEPSDQYKQWKETFGPKVAEQLVQSKAEGLAEGKIEGKIEVAQNLLRDGLDPGVVARNTGLSREQMETLLKDISAEKPPLP